MFTGIIEAVSPIQKFSLQNDAADLEINMPQSWDLELGESVSVNGVCLTVARKNAGTVSFFLSGETLDRSSFSRGFKTRTSVNLERALLPTTRLSGHFVQGHVDGTAEITQIKTEENGSILLQLQLKDPSLNLYCVEKGSICVEGVSLTINKIQSNAEFVRIELLLIPHTMQNTCFQFLNRGDWVNIEVDILGKYIAKQFQGRSPYVTL